MMFDIIIMQPGYFPRSVVEMSAKVLFNHIEISSQSELLIRQTPLESPPREMLSSVEHMHRAICHICISKNNELKVMPIERISTN